MSEKYIVGKFGGIAPLKFTQAYEIFASELNYSELLLFYILSLDKHIPEDSRKNALDDLKELFHAPDNLASNYFIDLLNGKLGEQVFKPETYENYFGQIAFARCVDNFITYLKDLLGEVVLAKPEILKSKDQEKLEFILSFDTYEDLKRAIAEKKVEDLFYKGINDIENFFRGRLGVEIFIDEDQKKAVNLMVKQRNLIVHNRGVISNAFIKEFPEYSEHISDKLVFSYAEVSIVSNEINKLVVYIDNVVAEKFGLTQTITPILSGN